MIAHRVEIIDASNLARYFRRQACDRADAQQRKCLQSRLLWTKKIFSDFGVCSFRADDETACYGDPVFEVCGR